MIYATFVKTGSGKAAVKEGEPEDLPYGLSANCGAQLNGGFERVKQNG